MVEAIERAALADAARARVMVAVHQARELEHLAVYARECLDDRGELHDFAHFEVATLLHISDRAARRRLEFALTLIDRLPATLIALGRGLIEEYKAQLIADAVESLTAEQAGEVEQLVLKRAASQTPGQLRNALTKAVMAVDPEGAEARRQKGVRERRVESQPTDHGQAVLSIYDSTDRIAAMHGLITAMAHDIKNAGGETRTISQIEADVARELILGSDCERRTVEVHLTLPATTALRLDDQPGEVDGVGAIPAQAARDLLAEASRWRWIRTNPETGHLDDLTYARYRPPKILKEFIRVRDRTCTFQGCTRPARRCDVDHITRWPDGTTCDTNCACLCRRHHRAKHDGGWRMERIDPDWVHWTSPLGFTHTVQPDPIGNPQPPPKPKPVPVHDPELDPAPF